MTSVCSSIRRTASYEFEVSNPAVHRDISDALFFAAQKFSEVAGREVRFDDDLRVRADEEHIIVYFEVEEK